MIGRITVQRPAVLLLAAGRARRFGEDKRKVLLYKGETLLRASLGSYLDAGLEVIVCLSRRSEDNDLARELAKVAWRVLRCDRSDEGMGATLAEGIRYCRGYPGTFIALADMPCIRSATLQQVETALTYDGIVVPTYRGRRGHPVLFGAAWFDELATLGGDRGAAVLLSRYARACREIAVDDPGIHRDVDTPAALAALRMPS